MKHSEFWLVVDRAMPNGRGRAIVKDLVLPDLDSQTGEEALSSGVEPQSVWHSIREAMDLPERFEYLHKISSKDM